MSMHPCLCAHTQFFRVPATVWAPSGSECVNLCPLHPCVCLDVNLLGLTYLHLFRVFVGLCVCPCVCHSMRVPRSLYVFHPPYCVWDPFLFVCLRVTFVCLCVPPSFRMILCARVSHSFFRVCVFVSPCIS